MVALWIYYKGLKTTQVKVSTIIELSFPLVAIFIDIFLYQTTLAPSQYLAAMALLFCMYQVTKPTLSKKPSPAANH
jgi:drug/metabolite transporter (DMT)-like permease